MKLLLLTPIVGLALFANSCRTEIPLDPASFKSSENCMPANHQPPPSVQPTK